MKKPSNLPRYKSSWNNWKYVINPGPYYYGGNLHYVDKKGHYVHAKGSEKLIDIRNKIMTKSAFKKKFGHLLRDKEYMNFIKKHM